MKERHHTAIGPAGETDTGGHEQPAARRAAVLCGDEAWCHAALARLASAWRGLRRVLLPGPDPVVPGGETDVLVVDGFGGFDPDAFGRAVGTVRGGGILVFLTPPLERWSTHADPQMRRLQVALYPAPDSGGRYVARLARVLAGSRDLTLVRQGDAVPDLVPSPRAGAHARTRAQAANAEQARAIEAVVHVVTGHRRRPLVLTSDRGRGKSAAFGLAAAELLKMRCTRILVTAPHRASVETLFAHALCALPGATAVRGSLVWQSRELSFIPPDLLLAELPDADLLLVDEAAAIPSAMLHGLLARYSRIAFATTVHGYEGTGRGFAVRFNEVLARETPGWVALGLHTPVRWPAHDPVERLAFRLLLLDAVPADDERVADTLSGQCRSERLDRDALAADEGLLAQLFGLLVLAHYRTRPFDLRHLLDGPNVEIHAMRRDDAVVATACTAREGGFGRDVLEPILLGESRPHGHLLPEALSAHLGLADAPTLRCARVLRIAVHPAARRRGVGTALLRALVEQARADGIDYLGASFGATPELLRFWSNCEFVPVRLSVKQGTASGEHSVLMLRGLTAQGMELIQSARERFARQFPAQLNDVFAEVEPALVLAVLRLSVRDERGALNAADWRDLYAFAHGRRQYESCIAPLRELVLAKFAGGDPGLEPAEAAVMVARVLQGHNWARTARRAGLSGRTEVLELMRRVARRWLP